MKNLFRIITVLALMAVSMNASAQKDWAKFYRYADDNAQVLESGTKVLAVLMGDSITDNWLRFDPDFFSGNGLRGRGISGQVTSQMLVRFRKDVIDLKPKYVAILAGTNDIALNNGPITLEDVMGNIISMCELAKAHKIKPVLCSVLPASKYGWRPQLTPAEDIKKLNAMIQAYAKAHKYAYVDYWSMLADENGGLSPEHAADGVHPNLETYKLMEELLMKYLK